LNSAEKVVYVICLHSPPSPHNISIYDKYIFNRNGGLKVLIFWWISNTLSTRRHVGIALLHHSFIP